MICKTQNQTQEIHTPLHLEHSEAEKEAFQNLQKSPQRPAVTGVSAEDRERFWSKVHKLGPDECWPWMTYRQPNGYGNFGFRGITYLSHRFAYEISNGPLGVMCCCHRCDNPWCCNPKHLFAGTQKDNMHDRVRKGHTYTGNHKGEAHGRAILNDRNVREIRLLLAQGKKRKILAKEYSVSLSAIHMLAQRKTWTHVA